MKRRDFIKHSLQAGVAASVLYPALTSAEHLSHLGASPLPYDLVAVKGGEPAAMFDKAIASLGGMQAFVKKGQSVVVKPNIGWDVVPERAANTNPFLVKRIVEHCFNAGAKDVFVFDNTCDKWTKCYANSGIEKAVKDAGGKMVPGNTESYYHDVTVAGGKRLTNAKIHELISNSNVFINVPILKSHSSTKLTIGMKNYMGVVWDREFWHRNDLHQCIADFATYCKPHLTIVDAYAVMKNNGPRGVSQNDVVIMKSLVVGKDVVAVDAAAAKLAGFESDAISYIKIADEMKIGTRNLQLLKINRINL